MKTIIEIAREADLIDDTYQSDWYVYQLSRFAELVTEQTNARANTSWAMMCKKMVEFEREACAKVAERSWQEFQDTKNAHERLSPAPFKLENFGFNQSTIQQSQIIADNIRARGQA